MNAGEITSIRVSELVFDRKNPRLPEFDLSNDAEESEVVRVLWEAMDVRELVLSIAASGFFQHEPLIVMREHERNVVIEGNRRLAAVRILLDPTLAEELRAEVPEITNEARRALDELPTISGTRAGAWRYLGFKHVNGPAKWSSYAKSLYIADVHDKFGVSLEDIAKQIGDTHKTVQRLFRGLMVIRQAEALKVFSRHDRWRNHFSFSHLYTGLDYPSPRISDKAGNWSRRDEDRGGSGDLGVLIGIASVARCLFAAWISSRPTRQWSFGYAATTIGLRWQLQDIPIPLTGSPGTVL